MRVSRKFNWVSALDKNMSGQLNTLQSQMADYYSKNNDYYTDISFNENVWLDDRLSTHRDIISILKPCENILEVGCGRSQILRACPELIPNYTGLDFSSELMKKNQLEFSNAKFHVFSDPVKFPFPDQSFDCVFSHFVIEHTVHPDVFLDECLRVLKPNGYLVILCPDFLGYDNITSQRVGFSQGSGREKLSKLKIFDAIVTGFDTKIRLPRFCKKLKNQISTAPLFMINLNPTCFSDSFQPDVDAVYVTYRPEIIKYLNEQVSLLPNSIEIEELCRQRRLIYFKAQKN